MRDSMGMIQKWCQNTSLNGIIDLYEARGKKPQFIFWSCIMIAMFVLTILLTTQNIATYVNTPTVSKMDTIAQKSMEMPEMLLCYKGGLNVARLKSYNMSKELINVLQSGYMGRNPDAENASIENEFTKFLSDQKLKVKEFYKRITSHDCEDIVLSRTISGGFNRDTKCENVTIFVKEDTSPCLHFTYNGKQSVADPERDGIHFVIKSPKGSETSTRSIYSEFTNSFTLSLEKTFVVQGEVNIEIPLGYKITILLTLTRVSRLGKSRPCFRDSDHDVQADICHKRSITNLMIEHCNCTFPSMYAHKDLLAEKICTIFEFKKICFPQFDWIRDAAVTMSKDRCLEPCDEYLYGTSLSFAPLDANNVTKVVLGYGHIHLTSVEEVDAFTWDVAIANVGGQAGLWMGCSIVTIIQGVFYCFLCSCKKMPLMPKKSLKVNQVDKPETLSY